ncbi:MAG: hypothetical protein ACLGH0_00995, partial [Thermoanaerobaculia bacterium]
MDTALTLQQVREMVAHDEGDGKVLEAIDDILTFLLAVTPAVAGLTSPAGALALALLAVKQELARVGKNLLARLQERANADPATREQHLLAAHTVMFYAAFLEVLDSESKAPKKRTAESLEALVAKAANRE